MDSMIQFERQYALHGPDEAHPLLWMRPLPTS